MLLCYVSVLYLLTYVVFLNVNVSCTAFIKVLDIFTALYQGNTGVSGMASNTSPVSGMMHMNMGMSGITQQPAQQSAENKQT